MPTSPPRHPEMACHDPGDRPVAALPIRAVLIGLAIVAPVWAVLWWLT